MLRALLGDLVFGVDDETMEIAVGALLEATGLTLGLAESVTGGLIGARLTDAPGASAWFRGSIVSYASDVKFDVLGVPPGPVVSAEAAEAMAAGARRVLGADIGLSVTGVAGPAEQDGQQPGTSSSVWRGTARSSRRGSTCRATAAGPPVRHDLRAEPVAPPPHRDDKVTFQDQRGSVSRNPRSAVLNASGCSCWVQWPQSSMITRCKFGPAPPSLRTWPA